MENVDDGGCAAASAAMDGTCAALDDAGGTEPRGGTLSVREMMKSDPE
jgi:hypothetical protein